MREYLRLLIPILVLLGVGVAAAPAGAQPLPEIVQNDIDVAYPRQATFRLEMDADITAATLSYRVPQFNCVTAVSQVPVEPEGNSASWAWIMNRSGNPPPGTEVTWSWTVTTADGETITTPAETHTFRDDRFPWQSIEGPDITLYWYEGEEVGPILYDAAVAGLDRLQNDMGIVLQQHVQLFIYGSAADMRDAVVYIQDWAGGVAFTEYGTILIGVPPTSVDGWGTRTVRHELAHLVLGQFGRSCVGGDRPTWLEEGLATYAEGAPDENVLADISRGVEENAFSPIRSLAGAFPAHGSGAGMAYSQSYSIVNYLLDTYGQEPMQELILTLAAGESTDAALGMIYGFDSDGLEAAWRQAVGAPARTPRPTPTAIAAGQIPTVEPLAGLMDVPTPAADVGGAEAGSSGAAPVTDEEETGRFNCLFGLAFPLALAGFGIARRRDRRE